MAQLGVPRLCGLSTGPPDWSSDDLLVTTAVPHRHDFRGAATAAHHGGSETSTRDQRPGMPQVVVPFFADHTFWAGVVAGAGLGPHPRSWSPSSDGAD